MNSFRFFCGLLVILLGAVLVGLDFGWWNSSIWQSIYSLWPIFIIAIGLNLMVKNQKLLSLFYLFLILASVGFVAYVYDRGAVSSNAESTVSESYSGTYNQAITQKLSVHIKAGATKLTVAALPVSTAAGTLYQLETYDLNSVLVNKSVEDGDIVLTIEESSENVSFYGLPGSREMVLYLPSDLLMDVDIDSGASKLNLNLSNLQIENITLDIGASTAEIFLSNRLTTQTINLNTGVSSISFHAPANLGIKATFGGGLNSIDSDSILNIAKDGDSYVSDNFSSASSRLIITGDAGLSSLWFQTVQ